MKLIITESQLRKLVSELIDTEIDEEEGALPPASEAGVETPTSGTPGTDTPEQTTGYPEVHKWESGVKRGPANPVPIQKWTDTEGTQPVRGKANTLN